MLNFLLVNIFCNKHDTKTIIVYLSIKYKILNVFVKNCYTYSFIKRGVILLMIFQTFIPLYIYIGIKQNLFLIHFFFFLLDLIDSNFYPFSTLQHTMSVLMDFNVVL